MGRRECFGSSSIQISAAPTVAVLLALIDDGLTALVQATSLDCAGPVRRARTTIDLHGGHIGAEVLLLHEDDDAARPIVIGVLRGAAILPQEALGVVDVQADGRRLVVSAVEQLTLRCGSASIVLTHDGKVLIEGRQISSHSTGVNAVRGGSVRLN